MDNKKYSETFEVRLSEGRLGQDPEAPDWEVREVRREEEEVACDNLTRAEAEAMAAMWSRKRDEAEADG
ncbi:MAG TPA: hypothetical protein VF544_17110 [Pyrinomonadaceae bacterium]|jgi:hypothetical protein